MSADDRREEALQTAQGSQRVLVAGIGNIFLGDDGFGVEVARRLTAHALPENVHVADYGIRGMHLAYDLSAEGYDVTILVDTVPRDHEPGTISVLEVRSGEPGEEGRGVLEDARMPDAHGMAPDAVLELLDVLGGGAGRVLLVGCEPAELEQGIGLSPRIAAAVDAAAETVIELVRDLPAGESVVHS